MVGFLKRAVVVADGTKKKRNEQKIQDSVVKLVDYPVQEIWKCHRSGPDLFIGDVRNLNNKNLYVSLIWESLNDRA